MRFFMYSEKTMTVLRIIGLGMFTMLVGAFLALTVVVAQVVNKWPVPSNIWTAGQIATATDANNLGVAVSPFATQIKTYSQNITPSSVAANLCAEQTFTVNGLITSDKVFFNPVAAGNATSAGQVRVSAADTLAVTYCNPTSGALTPGAGTAEIVAIRS